jgi:hypothetical protein
MLAWLKSIVIWKRLWPLAVTVFTVVQDGKITVDELKTAVDVAFGDTTVIKLW